MKSLGFDACFVLRITKQQHADLKKLAHREEMRSSELLRRMLTKELARLKKKHNIEDEA